MFHVHVDGGYLASILPLLNRGVIKVPWIALMVRLSVKWSYPHVMVMFYDQALMVIKRSLLLCIGLFYCFKGFTYIFMLWGLCTIHAYWHVRFIVHAFYLPCLVLYVLTHIVSFPLQVPVIAFLSLLVARNWELALSLWVLIVRGHSCHLLSRIVSTF